MVQTLASQECKRVTPLNIILPWQPLSALQKNGRDEFLTKGKRIKN
jgi:hypothetical protein